MVELTENQKIHYTLRIAVAMCFIGHGAFGIITKPVWCNYFAVVGIDQHLSYQLMPVVGGLDIALGIVMLIYPLRFVPAWLVFWGLLTALMRPLSGEPFAEFIERAGNYGAPLALLILAGMPQSIRDLFKRINPNAEPGVNVHRQLALCLRIVVFLLLAGHGWLNCIGKKGLLDQYSSLGFSDPSRVALIIGIVEITAAFAILIKPLRPVIFIFLCWKIISEVFYPHYALFEWIERGGSYGALLALWWITAEKNKEWSFRSRENDSFVISNA